jgi:hypothetical protein
MAELNFDNIISFSYELTDKVLHAVIQLKNPVSVRKRLKGESNTVRSPFNMQNQNEFLNYWNLNQTFYLKGVCDL